MSNDGFSCDKCFVVKTLPSFLCGTHTYIVSTYINHNFKSGRSQIIVFNIIVVIGSHRTDVGIFRLKSFNVIFGALATGI